MNASVTEQILSQMPGQPWVGLQRADALWTSIRSGSRSVLPVIQSASNASVSGQDSSPNWDVVICGATLGVILGTALAQRGWRVALLERGQLRGRDQEWNISRQELSVLVRLQLLSEAELEGAIASQYNPARIAFHGDDQGKQGSGFEATVHDVLNLGVDPVYLLDRLKQKFLDAGGKLFEHTAFQQASVGSQGVTLQAGDQPFSTRLLLDMMGHFSPIAQQARQGQTPDGICLVVGTCAQGYDRNDSGDLMVSFTPLRQGCQYFWEAFPARDGRTTYLFTYLDATGDRPSLQTLFDDYFELLPQYQQISLDQLQFQRALFGILPSYRQSPLKPAWDRILQVGDSSGTQSPLSFGGFGALLRHLDRLVTGVDEALQADCLSRGDLGLINGYQPNLSVTWLFQRAMSTKANQSIAPNQINHLLSQVFRVMDQSGDTVLKPFLQDVIQFPALAQTMLKTGLTAPGAIVPVIPQVGLPTLLGWTGHYTALAAYSLLQASSPWLQPLLEALSRDEPKTQFRLHRWQALWQYGSGADYDQQAEPLQSLLDLDTKPEITP